MSCMIKRSACASFNCTTWISTFLMFSIAWAIFVLFGHADFIYSLMSGIYPTTPAHNPSSGGILCHNDKMCERWHPVSYGPFDLSLQSWMICCLDSEILWLFVVLVTDATSGTCCSQWCNRSCYRSIFLKTSLPSFECVGSAKLFRSQQTH